MNAQIEITPRWITADHDDGLITLSLRESRESVVVVSMSKAQVWEMMFALEDALEPFTEEPKPCLSYRGSATKASSLGTTSR